MTIKNVKLAKKFGLKIKVERTKRELSQDELSELAGLHRNAVGAIERGISSPTLDTIYLLAKALKINLKDILNLDL